MARYYKVNVMRDRVRLRLIEFAHLPFDVSSFSNRLFLHFRLRALRADAVKNVPQIFLLRYRLTERAG